MAQGVNMLDAQALQLKNPRTHVKKSDAVTQICNPSTLVRWEAETGVPGLLAQSTQCSRTTGETL